MASESAPPATPTEEAPTSALPSISSATASLSQLSGSQASLAKKITADWQWLSGLYESYAQSSNTALRANCTTTRMRMQSAIEAVRDGQMRAELTLAQLTEPPAAVVTYKDAALEFRRKYKAFMVGGLAVLSILPAVRAGPGKLEKVRVALRNFFCVGGGASVLMYPEFAFGVAPALVSRGAERVQNSAFLSAQAQRMMPKL